MYFILNCVTLQPIHMCNTRNYLIILQTLLTVFLSLNARTMFCSRSRIVSSYGSTVTTPSDKIFAKHSLNAFDWVSIFRIIASRSAPMFEWCLCSSNSLFTVDQARWLESSLSFSESTSFSNSFCLAMASSRSYQLLSQHLGQNHQQNLEKINLILT